MTVEYVGATTMTVDGVDVEITKVDIKDQTGRKVVKTMNRKKRARGFMRGVGEYQITATAVIPTDGTAIDWGAIEDSRITIEPDIPGGVTEIYTGFCVTEVGKSYTVDNEAVIDISGFAIDKMTD